MDRGASNFCTLHLLVPRDQQISDWLCSAAVCFAPVITVDHSTVLKRPSADRLDWFTVFLQFVVYCMILLVLWSKAMEQVLYSYCTCVIMTIGCKS